jgi:hypothetical protein
MPLSPDVIEVEQLDVHGVIHRKGDLPNAAGSCPRFRQVASMFSMSFGDSLRSFSSPVPAGR